MKPLMIGSKDELIKQVQSTLNQFGISVGTPDGVFGSNTLKGVKQLQKTFGLTVDGIIGDKTINLSERLSNITHFKFYEFKCRHCGSVYLDISLLEKLEELRNRVGALRVTSGYRCKIHNRNVGGSRNSQHTLGTASDLKGLVASPTTVYNEADKLFSLGGVGKYRTFTHVDTRGYKARW